MTKVLWGVISTANIGMEKVIPAMQKGQYSEITAISSRSFERAKQAAKKLGIPKAYGSYEELLRDDEITAVYISLPNHLHVEWTIKALEAGKHVLCEKPISMNYKDALYLAETMKKFPKLKVMEAFMYRHHPQWKKIKELIYSGEIGDLKSINAAFSYHNTNPADVRNQADIGGGGLLDIGCYCISVSRFIFEDEPESVSGSIEFDPVLKIDRLASGILRFKNGTSTFTCSTQLVNNQIADIFGTKGWILVEKPFTPLPDETCKILLKKNDSVEEFVIEPASQYTIQGDLFSLAVLNDTNVPTPIEDALSNMKVIDAVFESSRTGSIVNL
jgi:predicted dehydrogenase